MQHVQNIQYVYLLNKYLKCSAWRLALQCDIYIYMLLGFKRLMCSNIWTYCSWFVLLPTSVVSKDALK